MASSSSTSPTLFYHDMSHNVSLRLVLPYILVFVTLSSILVGSIQSIRTLLQIRPSLAPPFAVRPFVRCLLLLLLLDAMNFLFSFSSSSSTRCAREPKERKIALCFAMLCFALLHFEQPVVAWSANQVEARVRVYEKHQLSHTYHVSNISKTFNTHHQIISNKQNLPTNH